MSTFLLIILVLSTPVAVCDRLFYSFETEYTEFEINDGDDPQCHNPPTKGQKSDKRVCHVDPRAESANTLEIVLDYWSEQQFDSSDLQTKAKTAFTSIKDFMHQGVRI